MLALFSSSVNRPFFILIIQLSDIKTSRLEWLRCEQAEGRGQSTAVSQLLLHVSLETSTILDARKAEISALKSHSMLYICDNNWPVMFHFPRPLIENPYMLDVLVICYIFLILVYPSLESEEDNPVFKSRSKKRKSNDDTPYSPTGKYSHY